MLFQKTANGLHSILHHIINIGFGGGGGGEGPIHVYFVSACQMMLKLEFFPRVLYKIVANRTIINKCRNDTPLEAEGIHVHGMQCVPPKISVWFRTTEETLLVY